MLIAVLFFVFLQIKTLRDARDTAVDTLAVKDKKLSEQEKQAKKDARDAAAQVKLASQPCGCKTKCRTKRCGCRTEEGKRGCGKWCGCRADGCLNPGTYASTDEGNEAMTVAFNAESERVAAEVKTETNKILNRIQKHKDEDMKE